MYFRIDSYLCEDNCFATYNNLPEVNTNIVFPLYIEI